jgi:phosphate transport system protein
MSQHFSNQIEGLKRKLLAMGALVERNATKAIQAVEAADTRLAWDVISADMEIDECEIEVGEACLHTLALYHPVASDMRFVASVLTINKDLERIGDLSVNLAEQAMFLAEESSASELGTELSEQCEVVLQMVRQSLQALVRRDPGIAHKVIERDDDVDLAHREMYRLVKQRIVESRADANTLIDRLVAFQQLERMADHAVNIAEDVIYMAEGKIVRHQHLDKKVLPTRVEEK